MLVYCTFRYRLFSSTRWLGLAIVSAFMLVKDLLVPAAFGIGNRFWVHAAYLIALAALGFSAPPFMRAVRMPGDGDGRDAGRDLLRDGWEVFAALGIMAGVLAVLDLHPLRQPVYLLASAPLAFLVAACFARITWWLVAAWMLPFAAVGAATGEWRYAGLGFTAAVLGLLALVRRQLRGSTARTAGAD